MDGLLADRMESMLKVAFVGWRGMVGSVLMSRMRECGDLDALESGFFSTSNAGADLPPMLAALPGNRSSTTLGDAGDVGALAEFDVVVTCQGGDYTRAVHPELRASGWEGYWIDAASAIRMEPETVLILDPINADVIRAGLRSGKRDYCGANCTVSLMLMGLGGLFQADVVEWMTTMTYQAASGGGAETMLELASQLTGVGDAARAAREDPGATALDVDRAVHQAINADGFPTEAFGAPLACSVLPWVDKRLDNGQSREEWKAAAEGNKILGREGSSGAPAGNRIPVPIDGVCVRVGSMRCHAQAVTVKLKEDLPLAEVERLLAGAHEWASVVENTPEATLASLTPAAVTGSLQVPVGRLRKLEIGPEYLTAFTVGDQLLWGAAEPLRRMLGILRAHLAVESPARERNVA